MYVFCPNEKNCFPLTACVQMAWAVRFSNETLEEPLISVWNAFWLPTRGTILRGSAAAALPTPGANARRGAQAPFSAISDVFCTCQNYWTPFGADDAVNRRRSVLPDTTVLSQHAQSLRLTLQRTSGRFRIWRDNFTVHENAKSVATTGARSSIAAQFVSTWAAVASKRLQCVL